MPMPETCCDRPSGTVSVGMEEAEQRADEEHDEQRRPEVDAEPHRHPPGHGAGGEDALDAEVEDAGALADQRAEHAEDQRRADADRRRPEIRREQDVEEVHGSGPVRRLRRRVRSSAARKRVKKPPTRTQRSDSATTRSAM